MVLRLTELRLRSLLAAMRSILTLQPIHQNVDESPRARFPARVGIAIADSAERAQQVRRIDILTYIAAGDRALHEGGDRARDQLCRSCAQGRGAGSRGGQRWRDNAFGGDVVDEQVHPLVQRLTRWCGLKQLRHGFSQVLDFAPVNRFHDCLSGWEVAIQGTDADASAARDFFQAHVQPDARKARLGGVNQQLPVARTVSAGFARRGSWFSFRDYRSTPHVALAKRRVPPYIKRRYPPLVIRPLLVGPAVGALWKTVRI